MPATVIYARKSTESEDRQVMSINSQIRELRTITTRQGISVSEVLTESRSAKAPGRPVFSELMRRVNAGNVGCIVAWKMDRLARNHMDTGRILQALADGKLERVVTSDRTYTRDGNDRFIGNFELGMATKFIDDLRANVRRGNRARFQRGWVNHIPPLGYLLDPATKTIVKDPKRFDLVRRMWELLLTASVRPERILHIANKEWGFRTRQFKRIGGGPLSRTVLYAIFANPFYTGIIRLRSGETFQGAHTPMVTQLEFDQAQRILGRPGRARPQRHEFPFTGLLRCGRCGGMITAERHRKPSGRTYTYYHCGRRKEGIRCPYDALTAEALETQMAEKLVRLHVGPQAKAWMHGRGTGDLELDRERRERALGMAKADLVAVARERENLLSMRLRSLIDDETYVTKKTELDRRQLKLAERLKGAGRSVEEIQGMAEKVINFATKAPQVFKNGTGVQKRMILEAVGSNYTLTSKRLALDFTEPFSLIAESPSRTAWSATWDEVRTWFEQPGNNFVLPDAVLELIYGTNLPKTLQQ
jgi:DNA invertase Pin-like site-specific DNA recombinase